MQAFLNAGPVPCLVCGEPAGAYDVVDFNKCCEEPRGLFLPLAGRPVYYHLCPQCGYCFAPELCAWPIEQFAQQIYNDDYERVDPDYKRVRPQGNADLLHQLFGSLPRKPRHLDYGGGNGALASALRAKGWDSRSYDPFVDPDVALESLGAFDLITAFEVFEHVPDPVDLVDRLTGLLADDGMVMFSTLVSDQEVTASPRKRLTWWYASPRNGHIGLFSTKSLTTLWRKKAMQFGSFNSNLHLAFRRPPTWCGSLFQVRQESTPA